MAMQTLDPPVAVADLEINDATQEVYRSGRTVQLTGTEYRLFRYLVDNAGHVVFRDDIMDDVWCDAVDVRPDVLDTYISYLRKKLDHGAVPLIRTIRGVGYLLRNPSGADEEQE